MAFTLTMPEVGETVTEGTIEKWLKQPGERVEKYEPIVEINTDKVDVELPSPVSGTLVEILAAEGVTSAFASFGGSSFLALGTPRGESGWRVLLRDAEGGFAGVMHLRDRSLSASGSLGQSVEIAGRAYGHVIDPRSGEPLVRAAQAAVVAPTTRTSSSSPR